MSSGNLSIQMALNAQVDLLWLLRLYPQMKKGGLSLQNKGVEPREGIHLEDVFIRSNTQATVQ